MRSDPFSAITDNLMPHYSFKVKISGFQKRQCQAAVTLILSISGNSRKDVPHELILTFYFTLQFHISFFLSLSNVAGLSPLRHDASKCCQSLSLPYFYLAWLKPILELGYQNLCQPLRYLTLGISSSKVHWWSWGFFLHLSLELSAVYFRSKRGVGANGNIGCNRSDIPDKLQS
jgi:hypothetical protein